MFSPRTIAIFALLAVAAAGPVADRPADETLPPEFEDSFPWFFPFGGISSLKNFFNPFLKWFPSFGELGPRVQVTDDNFRVIINADGYRKEDLKVKVKGDYIIVQGSHEAKRDDHDLFASQFFNSYSLPANASAAAVTATLTSDNFLVVDAPISEQGAEPAEGERLVPIVESGKPLESEATTTATAPAGPTSPAPDREEVTDRDNDIPHGTESELAP
ncbi:alpha-crystallin A chain-like [Aricia agestis]|uniref:alpha-crystallin A chain-like n=1 Tax=Aricia agestis TaxID=91739 RepID=UPI001C20AA6D|nr:alpha-crystallin A chain-like [Aricia agestis]